jgi:acetyl-CoA C-acetyltransferase
VLSQADDARVIRGVWRYGDPARVLATRFGAANATTVGTHFGGNSVQMCLNDAANLIMQGEREIVWLAGAENGRSHAAARRKGVRLPMSEAPGEPDRVLGGDGDMYHPVERSLMLLAASHHYALYESAIRAARGESLDAHRRRIAELWAGFSRVASENPNAWLREGYSAEEIAEVGPDNPMIATPYPRRMNANSRVDMGGALIVTSAGKARELGVAPDKLVYLHSATDAKDITTTSERALLHESPAMRIAGRRALDLAGLAPEDVDHVDLYSCFPSAVQVAAQEIGLGFDRPLTVTGGLTFGGGPLNDYVMHSIARMAEVLRADRGSKGLVTSNGGYLAKHAFGVYSTEPPAEGFVYACPQAEIDAAAPRRVVAEAYTGPVEIEAFTVVFQDDGNGNAPHHGFAAGRTPEEARAWCRVEDAPTLAVMAAEELCGRKARFEGEGRLALL